MSEILYIDFETYSECDIKLKGRMNYAMHPSTQMVCMGYAFDEEPVHLLTPANDLPQNIIDHVESGGTVVAHNVTFDLRIWNIVCVRDFGWPELSSDQMVDSMALCQTYGLPASLADAGAALKLDIQKQKDGLKSIKICCCPDKNGMQHTPWGPHAQDFKRLFSYCKTDVAAMREIVKKIPKQRLLPIEHRLWKLTLDMNSLGLPVDIKEATAIKDYVEKYVEEAVKVLPKLSGGAFDAVTQLERIKAWMAGKGYVMETMDADAIKKALKDPLCPEEVKTILVMRQELGRTSTAKYTKLLNLACKVDGTHWLHDNLCFHGARPGRWSGKGFQIQNLPRASVRNEDLEDEVNDQIVEDCITAFLEGKEVTDPVGIAKALIRPMVKAPESELFLCSDYTGIENRVLHWLARDTEALDDFNNNVDQYKTMAAARFNVSYHEVTKPQRQLGKVIILGCGYGMGAPTFVETADVQFGVIVTLDEAKASVSAYREKYYKVKALWNGLKLAAVRAVMTGQQQTFGLITFGVGRVNGTKWLAMRLPSGKCVYYMEPFIEQLFIPEYEHMGKVPTITHWGINPYSKKWSRLKLIPGRITENAVQGTAREVMGQGMLNVVDHMPEVRFIATVHDEGIGLIKKADLTDSSLNTFNTLLCDIPWAKEQVVAGELWPACPIKAEGWIGTRYRK